MPSQSADTQTIESTLRIATQELCGLLESMQGIFEEQGISRDQFKAVEQVLASHESLMSHRESILELIYVEFMARREAAIQGGLEVDALSNELVAEMRERFPDLQNELEKLFQVDMAFASLRLGSAGSIVDRSRADQGKGVPAGSDFEGPTDLGCIGDYRLIEEIGHGGMGVVYRAIQGSLGRTVALKTLDGLQAFDREEMDRLRVEAELASKLQHPNIVQIFEVGTFDEVPFFSMEYVAGGNLADAVGKQPLHPDTCARLVAIIARAVGYAHRQGVVHRDLKPSNILLSPSTRPEALALRESPLTNASQSRASHTKRQSVTDTARVEPKIGDFGLAIGGVQGDRAELPSQTLGTPGYMSPEQLEKSFGAAGATSDIYSLGAILYDLISGKPPFQAATVQETLNLVRTQEPISLRRLQPRLPNDLETICFKCLRKDPELRYESADELANDLDRFVARLPIQARPATRLEKGMKWVRRHPSVSFLLSSIAVALIVITGLWQVSERNRLSEKKARQRGEQLIYVGQIAQANQEFGSQDIERCRAQLDECDPQFRNWEWHYLKNLTYEPIWESSIHSRSVVSSALSPDGRLVAIGHGAWNVNCEQSIQVWDIETNKLLWQLEGHPASEISDVRFSPNSQMLVSAAVVWGKPKEYGNVIVWNLETGEKKHEILDTNARVARVSPDGNSLIVGCMDGTIAQFDFHSGEKIREFKRHKRMVFDLAFGPSDQFVTCSRDGLVCVWNLNGESIAYFEGMGDPRNIAWSPDGKEIRIYSYGGLTRTFSIQEGQFRLVDSEDSTEFRFERFSPDGMHVATAEFGLGARLRFAHDGSVVRVLQGHRGHVRSLSFDATGTRLATGGSDGSVRVWDLARPEPNTYRGVSKSATVCDIAFHPTRPEFAVAMKKTHSRPDNFSGLPRIEIWDNRTFEIKKTFLGHQDWLTCLRMDESGTRMISGSHDKTVRIWNTSDGKEVYGFDQHRALILDACFAAPSLAVSIDADAGLYVWNQETGQVQKRARVLESPIKLAEMLPAHRLVAAVSNDNRMVVWDWSQSKSLVDVVLPFAVRAIAFSPNRKWIAVAGENQKTWVWDFDRLIHSPSTSPNLELDGHADLVTSLCFSPDSQRLISTGNDETVRMFELSVGRELLKLQGLRGLENFVAINPDSTQLLRFSQRNFRAWNKNRRQDSEAESINTVADWHAEQARTALRHRNLFAANFHSKLAVQHDSLNGRHWQTRALTHIHSDDWVSAEIDIRRGIETESTTTSQNMLARVLLTLGKKEEYQQQCRALTEIIGSNDEPSVINSAAWICSVSSNSETDFGKWIELLGPLAREEKSPYYWNTLALQQYRAKQYPESIRSANESINLGSATSAPYDWIIKALCYADQEIESPKAKDSKTKKQSALRRKNLETHVASFLDWFDQQQFQIDVGLDSSKLLSKENSVELPMLIRELHAKLKTAGIDADFEKLESMFHRR